jgi:hypothetical protein
MTDYPPDNTSPLPDQPRPAVQQAPRNGLGITALILGIIGVVTGIIPFFFWVAGILGVIGLILGFVGRGRAKRGEATNGTMALWGIITSAVAMVLSIVGLVILVGAFEQLDEDLSELESPAATAPETSAPVQEEEEPDTGEPAPEETPPDEPPAGGDALSDEGWTLTNLDVRDDGLGDFSAVGRVTNETGQAVEGAIFSLSVLDPDGGVVATMDGSVSNVDDGETVTVEFIGVDAFQEGDWTYEFTVEGAF